MGVREMIAPGQRLWHARCYNSRWDGKRSHLLQAPQDWFGSWGQVMNVVQADVGVHQEMLSGLNSGLQHGTTL